MNQAAPQDDDPYIVGSHPAHTRETQFERSEVRYTMAEAARIKGVSYHTVSRAVRSERLPALRLGRMALVSKIDLDAWQPMRERAPRKYRQRKPKPQEAPGVIDLASGERAELARRLTTLYDAIHNDAIHQPLHEFAQLIAERFAQAMEFERVTLWIVNETLTEIEQVAEIGTWYAPGTIGVPTKLPYDAENMGITEPGVIESLACWSPPPSNPGAAFFAPLVSGKKHIGYITGDRNGAVFSLTDAQIQLGQSLATQAALTIDLNRSRFLESQRSKELEAVLDQISEPVMVYDPARRVVAMSRVAKRIYGLAEDLDFATTPFSLDDLNRGFIRYRGAAPEDPPSARALAGEIVRNHEFEFVRHDDGAVRLLMVDAIPIQENGVVTAVVAVERDITDQRAAEEKERLHREQLERAVERTRVLSNISLALNAGVALPAVLRNAGRQLTHHMEGETGGVGLIEGDMIAGLWTFGTEVDPDVPMPVRLQDYPATLRAYRAGGPILNTYATASEAERNIMERSGTRSNLITPMIVDGDLYAAMYVNYLEETPELSDDLIEFCSTLAAQCIVAIKQARLVEQLEAERTALHKTVAQLRELADKLRQRTGFETEVPLHGLIDEAIARVRGGAV